MAHIDECVSFFFFSSRRRHTRFDCDWSSDVCSSDLGQFEAAAGIVRIELQRSRIPSEPSRCESTLEGFARQQDNPASRRCAYRPMVLSFPMSQTMSVFALTPFWQKTPTTVERSEVPKTAADGQLDVFR